MPIIELPQRLRRPFPSLPPYLSVYLSIASERGIKQPSCFGERDRLNIGRVAADSARSCILPAREYRTEKVVSDFARSVSFMVSSPPSLPPQFATPARPSLLRNNVRRFCSPTDNTSALRWTWDISKANLGTHAIRYSMFYSYTRNT